MKTETLPMKEVLPELPNNTTAATKETGIAAIKGLIGAIPFAGTALNEVLFEVRSRLHLQRVELLIQALSEKLERLGENSIQKETIHSAEFSDLFEDVVAKAKKTRSDQKRRLFADILANSIGLHPLSWRIFRVVA
jgi:hypothetical protein